MPTRDEPNLLVSLPPRARHLKLVRRVLGNFAQHLGMGERAIGDLKTVVSEACALAVKRNPGGGDAVRVEARREGSELAVSVRDRGLAQPRSGDGDGDGTGLGLQLIAGLSRFEIAEPAGGGTVVSMRLPLH